MSVIARHLRASLAAALLTVSTVITAGEFSVSPTSLALDPGERAAALHLHNTGTTPVQVQLRVFAWSQVDNQDVLAPTGGLVVSPPMVTLAPGQQQLVRVLRASSAPLMQEQSFRLLIDEVPVAVATPPPGAQASGISFVLRFSVPVLLAPSDASDPASTALWSLIRDRDGRQTLQLDNPGARSLQLADLRILDAQGQTLHEQPGLNGYVLAGLQRGWPLPAALALSSADAIAVRLNGKSGQVRLDAKLQGRHVPAPTADARASTH